MQRFLCVSVLVLAASLLAACAEPGATDRSGTEQADESASSLSAPAPAPPPSPAPEPSPTPLPATLSAQELLEASLTALREAGPFHFDTDVKISIRAGGLDLEAPMSIIGDYESADNIRASMSLSLILAVIDMEIVVKDGTTYLKGPLSDKWTVLPGGTPIFTDPSEFFDVEAA